MSTPLDASTPRPRWSGAHLGRAVSLLALGGFVLACFWAKWNPALAQEITRPRADASAKRAKTPAKSTPAPAVKSLTAGKAIDARALARLIDSEVQKRLDAEKVKAGPRSDDAEFLRRVYLDLVGTVPPPEKVRAFLDSSNPNRRAALVDELLADSRFGKGLAEVWSHLLLPRESNNRRLKEEPFRKWLADAFNAGKPLDKLVYELLTASGPQNENGAVTFFIANPTVDKMTDNVSRMFLGVQLQCAQCHNHPFTDYKQADYWGMAAFFTKTRLTANPQQAAKKGISPGIIETNKGAGRKKGNLPESAKLVPARFLQGAQPSLVKSEPYRPVLAKWVVAPNNPYFARAMVNRFWHQMFGRGLVHPVDDMHKDNPASHPALLATLAEQLRLHNYDAKFLIRAICASEAYQRTSRSQVDTATVEPDLYSQRLVRVMRPEQLFDSLVTVIGRNDVRKDLRPGLRKKAALAAQKKKRGGASPRDNFLNFFHVEDFNPLDYQNGIPQALRLMNSGQTNSTAGAVNRAMDGAGTPAAVIERLYLAALARRPSPEETARLTAYVSRQSNPRTAYGDILWALLNGSEFVLNH